MNIDISVVIPVFNSEKTLDELYIRLAAALERLCDSFEVLLIDDGSFDNSYEKACLLHAHDERVKVIKLQKNFGQQNAIMCGLNYAKGDYVITMDDDLQNPPEEIAKLLYKLKEGFDVIYGIPIRKMHSKSRNLGAAARDEIFSIICKKPRNIKLSSFRVMHKSLVRNIIKDRTSFVYISAIILKYTTNIRNVFVEHHPRAYGFSNYRFIRLVQLMIKIFMNYSRLGSLIAVTSRPQYEIRDVRL